MDIAHCRSDMQSEKLKFLKEMKELNQQELERLNSSFISEVEKSAKVDIMPTVRVRPTINIEIKQRVLNCIPRKPHRQIKNATTRYMKVTSPRKVQGIESGAVELEDEIELVTKSVMRAIS